MSYLLPSARIEQSRRQKTRRPLLTQRAGRLMAGPAVLITLAFTILPLAASFYLSTRSTNGFGSGVATGLTNYRLLIGDRAFLTSIAHSFVFALITTVFTMALGFLIAVALSRRVPWHRGLEVLVILPLLIPATIFALTWSYGLQPEVGWADRFAALLHVRFILTANGNFLLIAAAVAVLQSTSLPVIVMLNALRAIPSELQEAMIVDGAASYVRLLRLELPLTSPTFWRLAAIQGIYGYLVFDYVYVLSGGLTIGGANVVSTFVYNTAFEQQRFGYASAAAITGSAAVGLALLLIWLGIKTARRLAE